jgi:hypothetical protein
MVAPSIGEGGVIHYLQENYSAQSSFWEQSSFLRNKTRLDSLKRNYNFYPNHQQLSCGECFLFNLVLEIFLMGTVGSTQVVLAFCEVRDDFFLLVVFFLADEALYLAILALLFEAK